MPCHHMYVRIGKYITYGIIGLYIYTSCHSLRIINWDMKHCAMEIQHTDIYMVLDVYFLLSDISIVNYLSYLIIEIFAGKKSNNRNHVPK